MDATLMEPDSIKGAIAVLIATSAFATLCWQWVRELSFYRRNNWDFHLDVEPKSWDWMPKHRFRKWQGVSNSQRIKVYYPIFILGAFILMLSTIYSV
jgi:hypothetical protein